MEGGREERSHTWSIEVNKRGMTISIMGVWRPLCSEVQSIYSSLLTTSATQYTGDMTESLFSMSLSSSNKIIKVQGKWRISLSSSNK